MSKARIYFRNRKMKNQKSLYRTGKDKRNGKKENEEGVHKDNDDKFDEQRGTNLIYKDRSKSYIFNGNHEIYNLKEELRHLYNNSNNSKKKTRDRTVNFNIEVNPTIQNDLETNPNLALLAKHDSQSRRAFIQQNSQFLSFFYTTINDNSYKDLNTLVGLLTDRSTVLTDFVRILKEKGAQPDTIRGRLTNISSLIKIFAVSIPSHIYSNFTGFMTILALLTKRCRESIRLHRKQIKSDEMSLSLHGKQDLLKMWSILTPLAEKIIEVARIKKLNKTNYILLIRILWFGFWSENANGRMQAISSMTLNQFEKLKENNYTTSAKTKSFSSHGDQIIILRTNAKLLNLLSSYIKLVRTQVSNEKATPNAPVFLQ
jgi:hypothetical protein